MNPQVAVGQRWTQLDVPELGRWTPTMSVSVVLPARDNQVELDRTLATLRAQTYPDALLEVIVVDDSSDPALELPRLRPDRTRLVTAGSAQSHGSGGARHAGALASDSDIVLFLDSDMMADSRHVEAHARWHHVCDHALVLGRKWFVEVEDITPAAIGTAMGEGAGLPGLLDGRRQRTHDWQEALVDAQNQLTLNSDDAFLAVVGATISIRRESYQASGGFSAFGLRGIVDTEFGYRAQTSGCVIVPDWDALCWHQGARNFAKRGGEIKRARAGLAANHLPIPMFRQQNAGRQWAVPQVRLVIDTSEVQEWTDQACDRLLLAVDSALGSDVTDLAVTVVGTDLPAQWRDYVAHDRRVEVADQPLRSGFPSPFTVLFPHTLTLQPHALRTALEMLTGDTGVIRTLPEYSGGPSLEVWRTRTLERALRIGLDAVPAEVLGERWIAASALGVQTPQIRVTPQGMITTV